MKNVYKWRIVTNKYLYITDENGEAPFIYDKKTGIRTYPSGRTDNTNVDEGAIANIMANLKDGNVYRDLFNEMVALAMTDEDARKLTFLPFYEYFNIDDAACVEEAVTPKCEGYEPIFNVSAYTIEDTAVTYTFYAERNEQDKTLRYNLDLGIPRGLQGEPGVDGVGIQGVQGEPGEAAVVNVLGADAETADYTSVDIETSVTQDNEYGVLFHFKIEKGEKGDDGIGVPGRDGAPGVITNVDCSTVSLPAGSDPEVILDSSGLTITWNEAEQRWETSFPLEFRIPSGLQGEQGADGLPAVITDAYVDTVETIPYGEGEAWARCELIDMEHNNEYQLKFDFGIPEGAPGDSGTTGYTGGWTYNLHDPDFVEDETILEPYGLFDTTYHPSDGSADVTLTIHYPSTWGGGGGSDCDEECIKHRYEHYNDGSDSLSEGVNPDITYNNETLPFAKAQGIRSHAEGIGHSIELVSNAYGVASHSEGRETIAHGDYSHAEGRETLASGVTSHAEGYNTKANGEGSHTEGLNTSANGEASHAEGDGTKAIGDNSHAEGQETIAFKDYSHVEGRNTVALGMNSHSEGYGDVIELYDFVVSGTSIVFQNGIDNRLKQGHIITNSSKTEFRDVISIDQDTNTITISLPFSVNTDHLYLVLGIAGNYASHSEGCYTSSNGMNSHSEGFFTLARGSYSHAEGNNTYAKELASHAEGAQSYALGYASHAEGGIPDFLGGTAIGAGSHAEGISWFMPVEITHSPTAYDVFYFQFSVLDYPNMNSGDVYDMYKGTTLPGHTIIDSNGFDLHTCTNIFDFTHYTIIASTITGIEISGETTEYRVDLRLSDEPNANFTGILWGGVSNGYYSHTEGGGCIALGDGSHTEGLNTSANGEASHAEGYSTHAEGDQSHAEGNETKAIGDNSHAEGLNTSANGEASHAEGYKTKTSETAIFSHAEGEETETNGRASHSEGRETIAYGDYSHAEGRETLASGVTSHAEGRETLASGVTSHAEGYNTKANGEGSHTEGLNTSANGEASHAEGYSTHAEGDQSHAEGNETKASGDNSHAEGLNTSANGEASHAEGFLTLANGNASHAEGYGFDIQETAINAYIYHTCSQHGILCDLLLDEYDLYTILNDISIDPDALTPIIDVDIVGSTFMFPNTTIYTNNDYRNMFSGRTLVITSADKTTNETAHVAFENVEFALYSNQDITYAITDVIVDTMTEGRATPFSINIRIKVFNSIGFVSHSEGKETIAFGICSHAEGGNTNAIGEFSHSEGGYTSAEGRYSHTSGLGTIAKKDCLTVIGKYNKLYQENDDLFIIGNGTNDSNRSNVLSVNSNMITISNQCGIKKETGGSNNVVWNTNGGTTMLNTGDAIPVGIIQMYVGSTAPSGWLLCNGQVLGYQQNSTNYVSFDNTYQSLVDVVKTNFSHANRFLGIQVNNSTKYVESYTFTQSSNTITVSSLVDNISGATLVEYTGGSGPIMYQGSDHVNDATWIYPVMVPNFNGRFPLGVGNSDTTGSASHNLGTRGGTEKVTLTANESGLPAHRHKALEIHGTGYSGAGYNYFSQTETAVGQSVGYTEKGPGSGDVPWLDENSATGAQSAHNNMPPYLTVNFIIKY